MSFEFKREVQQRREHSRRVIERNKDAARKASKKQARYEQALRRSDVALEAARQTLRQAGYLKK
jgi:hypothetical protein